MARGWESKSVEQQQEEAASSRIKSARPLTPEEVAREQKKRGLELSRKRILQQLETATNPQHRQMLDAALADLEKRIKQQG